MSATGPTVPVFPGAGTGSRCGPPSPDLPPYNDYLFNGEFRGDKSTLEVTITEGATADIVIDVGTKTVTTQ